MLSRLTSTLIAGTALAVAAGGAAVAVSGGSVEGVPGFVAQVTAADASGVPARGCTGSLVEAQWVLTAGQCVAGLSGASITVTVGGVAQAGASVVNHPERDVALVRLTTPVSGVTPARLGASPAAGEELAVAGWGRTATEWVPGQARQSSFRVDTVTGNGLELVSAAGDASVCKGDAGGPLLRGADVVGLATSSWQRNCLDAPAETRDGARAVAVGDLKPWLYESISAPVTLKGMTRVRSGRFTADTRPDLVATEPSTGKLWLYPGTESGTILDRRVEIGRSGWNAISRYAAADFTGDGRSDLAAVEQSTGKLWLYTNTGQPGLDIFNGRTEIGRSSWDLMGEITAGDFTGDGRVDLVAVQTATQKLFLYRNTGGAGLAMLAAPVEIGASSWLTMSRLTAGDFTGDGRADLVTVQTRTGKLFHYRNTGGAGLAMLAAPTEIGRSGWHTMSDLTAGEFTGDARLDLFAVTATSDIPSAPAWVYPLDGTGTSEVATRHEVRQIG